MFKTSSPAPRNTHFSESLLNDDADGQFNFRNTTKEGKKHH